MSNPFHPFSTEHGLIVLIGFAAIAVFLVCGRCGASIEIWTTRTLAWLNLTAYPVGLIAWILQGEPLGPEHYLPFHLCDIAAITAGIALLTKHRLASSLTYFWGLAGTSQGLLTPAIEIGFPEPGCLTFFLQHFAIVAASLYLPIVHGWRPRRPFWKEITAIFAWSVLYLLFALVTNSLTGANFGYASHPPVNPSLLDHLGPWPWYLLTVQGIALILYSMLCLPFVRSGPVPWPIPAIWGEVIPAAILLPAPAPEKAAPPEYKNENDDDENGFRGHENKLTPEGHLCDGVFTSEKERQV